MIANFTSKTIPKYREISGIIERCIEYLVGNIKPQNACVTRKVIGKCQNYEFKYQR
jgi:hypothetical protein